MMVNLFRALVLAVAVVGSFAQNRLLRSLAERSIRATSKFKVTYPSCTRGYWTSGCGQPSRLQKAIVKCYGIVAGKEQELKDEMCKGEKPTAEDRICPATKPCPRCKGCKRNGNCFKTCGNKAGLCSSCDSRSGRRGACCKPGAEKDPIECQLVEWQFESKDIHTCALLPEDKHVGTLLKRFVGDLEDLEKSVGSLQARAQAPRPTGFAPAPTGSNFPVFGAPVPLFDSTLPGMTYLAGGALGRGFTHSVDIKTGHYQQEVPAPHGAGDDYAYRKSDGLLVWTSFFSPGGEVYARWPNGQIDVVQNLPFVNPIKFDQKTGVLYTGATYYNTGLYTQVIRGPGDFDEPVLIPNGKKVMLNSFEIGDGVDGRPADGLVYGPELQRLKIVSVNISTGEITELGPSLGHASYGTAFDSKGVLYSFENTNDGILLERLVKSKPVDKTYTKELVHTFTKFTMVDNFEIDPATDIVYLSMNGPYAIATYNLRTGEEGVLWAEGSNLRTPAAMQVRGDYLYASLLLGGTARYKLDTLGKEPFEVLHKYNVGFENLGGPLTLTDSSIFDANMFKSPPVVVVSQYDINPPFKLKAEHKVEGLASMVGHGSDVFVTFPAAQEIRRFTEGDWSKPTQVYTGVGACTGITYLDGYIFTVDRAAGRIIRTDATDGTSRVIVQKLSKPGAIISQRGFLAVLEEGRSRVLIVNPNGDYRILASGLDLTQVDDARPGSEWIGNKGWLAADAHGNVYVFADGSNNIFKVPVFIEKEL